MTVQDFEELTGTKFIDGFEMGSKAIVTDPCYQYDLDGCNLIIDGIMPGRWDGYIEYRDCGRWGHRVAELIVVNQEGSYECPIDPYDAIGVDSGQAGVFDAEWYRGQCHTRDSQPDAYWDICRVTLDDEPYGSFDDVGFVSSSGFGDGGYQVFTHEGPYGIDAISILFIRDEEM